MYNNVEIECFQPYVHILQAVKAYFLYLDVELTRDCVKVPSGICRTNIIFFQLFVNFYTSSVFDFFVSDIFSHISTAL